MVQYQLQIGIGNLKNPRIILEAIKPELNAPYARRSSTSVKIKNSGIIINIEAEDPAALRAATNSIVSSIKLSKSITEV